MTVTVPVVAPVPLNSEKITCATGSVNLLSAAYCDVMLIRRVPSPHVRSAETSPPFPGPNALLQVKVVEVV